MSPIIILSSHRPLIFHPCHETVIREYENISGRENCDLSLCTATTTITNASTTLRATTQKLPPQQPYKHSTAVTKPEWTPVWRNIYGSSIGFARTRLSAMSMKDDETDTIREAVTPSFGGVNLGIAQILTGTVEERSDISTIRSDVYSKNNHHQQLHSHYSDIHVPCSNVRDKHEDNMNGVLSYEVSSDESVEVFFDGNSTFSEAPIIYQKRESHTPMVPVHETSFPSDRQELQSVISIMTEEESLFYEERQASRCRPVLNHL